MPRTPGVPVKFRAPVAIDSLAANTRRRLAPDKSVEEKVDMMWVLENLDGQSVRLPTGGTARVKLDVDYLPKHILAETKLVEDRIYLVMNNSTYTMLSHDEGWARFTAAHEIGHVTMHLATLTELEKIGHHQAALARATSGHDTVLDSEFQSNNFAAAFLAPDEGLKALDACGDLDVPTVMKTFGMGRKSATARIDNYRRRGGRKLPPPYRGGR